MPASIPYYAHATKEWRSRQRQEKDQREDGNDHGRGHARQGHGRQDPSASQRGPRRHAHRLGRADRRWTTAWCCAPTCSGRSRTANIRSSSATAPTPRASPSRTAIRAPGSAWPRSTPTSPPARATSIRAGKWSIRRNGCRATTPACGSIPAAPAARRATSTIGRRARPRISTTASNGPGCSRGRTARSGSTAFPTTPSTSGTWRACSRRIWPPCASGRAAPTSTAR